MKKYIYSLIVILVVALFASLYTYATAFHVRNVESMTISAEPLNLEDEQTQSLIKKLQSLKQYDTTDEHEGHIIKLLTLDMKYGDDIQFEVAFDYNFSSLTIKSLESNLIYVINDDIVEWLYMQEAVDDIYDYKLAKTHAVTVNDQLMKNSTLDYHYTMADAMWRDVESTVGSVETIVIQEPKLKIDVVNHSGHTDLVVYQNDKAIYSGSPESFEPPKTNGIYRVLIKTQWKDVLYYGTDTTEFILETQYPPEFTVSDTEINQGEFIVIKGKHIYNPDALFIEQDYMEGLTFEKNGDYYECFIPSTYYTTPGIYSISYGVGDYKYEMDFEVLERTFKLQYLTVSTQTVQTTQTDEAYEEYREYYKKALEKNVYQSETSYLSEQAFLLPASGRLTTEYGVQRYVNDRPTSYRHRGLDIANEIGTPIKATYDGEVVLSMLLKLTGNTVVVSHGNGIFSSYIHMETLNVEEGDVVKRGDLVGTMGSTGFSTGSHLDFTISYYKMNLEPGYFIFGEPVTYDNYADLFNGH